MTKQDSNTGYNHSAEAGDNPRSDERLTQTGEGRDLAQMGELCLSLVDGSVASPCECRLSAFTGIWSLWDMLRVQAEGLMRLGYQIQSLRTILYQSAQMRELDPKEAELTREELEGYQRLLETLNVTADKLDLPVAKEVLNKRAEDLPDTESELGTLVDVIEAELKSKLFLHIDTHRAHYYNKQDVLSQSAAAAFPTAFNELNEASNCYALERYTATVFHSMRAGEIGVRLLAKDLSLDPNIVETSTWGAIQSQIQGAIKSISSQPRSPSRDANMEFYSQAAAQLQYFNDGWRVRVAHAKETYNQQQAVDALEHVSAFFESISSRLKETL